MASLFKKTTTKTDPKTGQKVKAKSRKWWGRWRAANGTVKRQPLASDKGAAQAMLHELVQKAERTAAGLSDHFDEHKKKPLKTHLEVFRSFMEGKDNNPDHVQLTVTRVRSILDGCRFVFIGDINPTRVVQYLAGLRREGRSITTSNGYLTAMKSFLNWMVKDKRARDNVLDHLSRQNTETDRRHDRRALAPEEFSKLLESAENGPPIETISGQDRGMLYILAAWTGYRRGELASITKRSLDLDCDSPVLRVQAGYSKRRRLDTVPLHPVVVERLRGWLATKADVGPDEPLFPVAKRKTSKMMRLDLERAGIPYVDADGLFADFHAQRHTFISNLSKAGVSPKVAQELARHSDIKLTMQTYTHLGLHDLRAGIESLPAPPTGTVSENEARELRATGTSPEEKGALYGAQQAAFGGYQDASDCTLERCQEVDSQEGEESIISEENRDSKGETGRENKGWMTGFEPATPRTTIWGSDAVNPSHVKELRKPSQAVVPSMVPCSSKNAPENVPVDLDLDRIIEAWPSLPEAIKRGIMAMVKAVDD